MSTPTPPTPVGSTLRSPGAWGVLLTTIVAGTAVDLVTKSLAFQRVAGAPVAIERERVIASTGHLYDLIPAHEPVRAVGDLLHLTLVLNPGAVFGIGAGKRWFFVAFTLGAIVVGLWLFASWTRPKNRWAHGAIWLVLAGGLGNLYDRLVYACVRDFLHPLPLAKLPFGITWPGGKNDLWPYVSNVADLYLIVGVAILMLHSLRTREKPGHSPSKVT